MSEPARRSLLAVDPGKNKCGLAVLDPAGKILAREVVRREEFLIRVRQWLDEFRVESVIVGGSTGSKEVVQELKAGCPLPPLVVNERHTTERARLRYFQDHPPRGFWRLVPLGLQVPPVPVDDYAAVVIAEDYLKGVEREACD